MIELNRTFGAGVYAVSEVRAGPPFLARSSTGAGGCVEHLPVAILFGASCPALVAI